MFHGIYLVYFWPKLLEKQQGKDTRGLHTKRNKVFYNVVKYILRITWLPKTSPNNAFKDDDVGVLFSSGDLSGGKNAIALCITRIYCYKKENIEWKYEKENDRMLKCSIFPSIIYVRKQTL